METKPTPTLALSDMFFDSFAKLSKEPRRKVQNFLLKFSQLAATNALDYEEVKDAPADYRSACIDDTLRAIICHPDSGNVYLLLWVAKRDDASQWARTHVCKVNPNTGSLQVYETQATAPAPKKQNGTRTEQPAMFASFSDDDLRSIGVPDDCLPLVRSIYSRDDLERERSRLPLDTVECLIWLADGDSLEEVKNVYGDCRKATNVEDALKNSRSQRTFCIVENDAAMRRLVDASLERWRIFLHPTQKKLVERLPGKTTDVLICPPMLVRGGAGTGKTVVAMHRAAFLVRHPAWKPDAKLLFTTFTKNLAIDISGMMAKLCSPDELRRIEIVNFDAWVANFLQRNKVTKTLVYPGNKNYDACWKEALTYAPLNLGFPNSFYDEEWRRVVLPQEIRSEHEYLRASRKGRGTALSRNQRKAVWPVFDEMRNLMSNTGIMTIEDASYMAQHLVREQHHLINYGAVVVDETQDFGNEALTLLAELARPDDDAGTEPNLFLVGDGQQRIYNRQGTLSACGINVRGRRSERLRLTYRTTEEIRRAAEAVLSNVAFTDMDDGNESQQGNLANRHGMPPVTYAAKSFNEECQWIIERINEIKASYASNGIKLNLSDICLVTRTNALLDQYESALEDLGVATRKLSRKAYDDLGNEGLRLATMHRIKGLEYKVIFIAGANEGVMPLRFANTDDPEEKKSLCLTEKSLFYVAASRAKDALFVSCHGTPGEFFDLLLPHSAH